MYNIYFIPGFGSNARSTKAQILQQHFENHNLVILDYGVDYAFEPVLATFKKIIAENGHPDLFIGASLGGFWASYLATIYSSKAIIINPSIEPSISLKKYLPGTGDMVADFNGFKVRELTEKGIAQYKNEEYRQSANKYGKIVFLAKDDAIIPYQNALDYYKNNSEVILLETGGHSGNEHMDKYLDAASRLLNTDIEREE